MITKNPMQLKAIIKKKATEKNIPDQLVLQNYMLERLLERISQTNYRNNFVLKGGFLIGAIVGLDTRTTMDLDATIQGLELSSDAMKTVFEEICKVNLDDNVNFEVVSIDNIRKLDDYPGIRIGLKANYNPISVPLFVDITAGDKITPGAINYHLKLLFDDRSIKILAYNLETLLAEKIETVISRNIANTRPRDFYDIYILNRLHSKDYDLSVLEKAIKETATKRGSLPTITDFRQILSDVAENKKLHGFWEKYQKDYSYAKGIDFNEICQLIINILSGFKF